MVAPALAPAFLPLVLAVGAITILLLPWLLAKPRLALMTLFASLLAGQLLRLPLPNQPGGLLLSDLATVIVLLAAVFQVTTHRLQITNLSSYWLLVTSPFILYSLWTNLIHWSPSPTENLIALAYWLRLAATLLLLLALLSLLSPPLTKERVGVRSLHSFTHYSLLITTVILCVLGFLQWWFLPDLTFLTKYGWDPHQSRLVSTWLDPNLFSAFLLIVIPYSLLRVTGYWLLVPTLASLALLLTKSRSGLLALAITLLIFSPLFVRYLIKRHQARGAIALAALAGLLFAAVLVIGFWLGPRARGLFTVDITAQLRLNSLRAALPLANQHIFTGVGYNRYQFAAPAAGLAKNPSLHSRAGTDNSLLTLLITTGLPGPLLFLPPWFFVGYHLLKKRAYPALFSFIALLLHSQFVNSLLYSHLLITLIIVVALSLSNHRTSYGLQVTDP